MRRFRIFTVIAALAGLHCVRAAADTPRQPESVSAPMSHFVWGADIGGSIDMSGHDMSTLNIDAYFGYRSGALSLLGVGVGLNIPVNNSRREFPLYAIARFSFTSRPCPVFAELRGGVVVNTHTDADSSTDLFLSPGIGFRLASGRAFSSYVIVGYIYNGLRTPSSVEPDSPSGATDELSNRIRGIHSAVVRLGITF
ncbi:MAG: hypothetical protein HFJ93_02610 [Muribaculaceae bacterium]|nr:hypothetical protein [Muribaculaceae bacterium]